MVSFFNGKFELGEPSKNSPETVNIECALNYFRIVKGNLHLITLE